MRTGGRPLKKKRLAVALLVAPEMGAMTGTRPRIIVAERVRPLTSAVVHPVFRKALEIFLIVALS